MSHYVANREHRGMDSKWPQYLHREHRYPARNWSSGGSSYGSHSRFTKSDRHNTARPSNPLRYKTELCRTFEESGYCRFAESCTFAHGIIERRAVPRHPRYKTELCRTYHSTGFCQYGARCHFIHSPEEQSRGFPLNNLRHHLHLDLFSSNIVPLPMKAGSVQSQENFHFMTASVNHHYDPQALQVGARPAYLGLEVKQAVNPKKCVLQSLQEYPDSLQEYPDPDIGMNSLGSLEYLSSGQSSSSRSASPNLESSRDSSIRVLSSPPISPTLKVSPNWDNSEEDARGTQGNCIPQWVAEDLWPATSCWGSHRGCWKEPDRGPLHTAACTCLALTSYEEPRKTIGNEMLATLGPSITNPMEVSRGLDIPSVLALNQEF